MFRHSRHSRAITADLGELDRRLRALESRLDRLRGQAASTATAAADRAGETVASLLARIADHLHLDTGALSDDATRLGNEVRKLSGDTARRLSHEVEQRPLIAVFVALGIGLLLGLASQRAAQPSR